MTFYVTFMCDFIDSRGMLRKMAAPAIIKAEVWGLVCDVTNVPDVSRLF